MYININSMIQSLKKVFLSQLTYTWRNPIMPQTLTRIVPLSQEQMGSCQTFEMYRCNSRMLARLQLSVILFRLILMNLVCCLVKPHLLREARLYWVCSIFVKRREWRDQRNLWRVEEGPHKYLNVVTVAFSQDGFDSERPHINQIL